MTIQNSSPFWTTRNVPLGLVFRTCGLFSSSVAADAVANGEAFASDCVCAISIDELPQLQSIAIRLSKSSSLFIDRWYVTTGLGLPVGRYRSCADTRPSARSDRSNQLRRM